MTGNDLAALLAAGLVAAVPLVLAALGEAFAERAGVLNLGIEGMVVAGAFAGFVAAEASGSTAAGLLAGLAAGLALALLFALLAVHLGVEQPLAGLAITIAATGLTAFLFRDLYAGQNPTADLAPAPLPIPFLADLPVVGHPLFAQPLPFYLAWASVPLAALVLRRTRFGLAVRAAGELPFAADAAGIDVARTRTAALALGGALAGLAGAYLSVVDLKLFQVGMTAGLGFIALALTMLGRWRPGLIALAALLFGLLRSLANTLQILGWDQLWGLTLRVELINSLPYLGVVLALALLARRALLPAALGRPYRRGER
jgi:ABC-type uncharacterized transport system permease subunit